MKHHLLSVLGYVFATFATQATSHFAVNAAHYAAVAHIKPDPIVPLGFLSMLIQGSVLSLVYARSRFAESGIKGALALSWMLGAFLVSYIALAEAGKYSVPDVGSWIAVEIIVGFLQFTLVGVLMGLAYRYADARAQS